MYSIIFSFASHNIIFSRLSFTLLFFVVILQFQESSWKTFSQDYPLQTQEPQGLLIGNDYIQFSGYTDRFVNATNHTYARDVTDPNSPWRRMEDVPVAWGITHVPVVAVGSKAYLCGGYNGAAKGLHIPDCFVYDHAKAPGTGQWSALPPLPHGGSGGGGMIYDRLRNALYFTGGAQRYTLGSVKANDMNNTYRYSFGDPSSGWVATRSIPYNSNHLSYVTHTDVFGRQRHFFLGGQEGEFECCRNVADNYEFIASTETWARRAPMLLARGHASASTRPIGCGFIIAGGSINAVSGSTVRVRTNDVSYYDIPTDTWTSIGSLPSRIATPLVDIHPNGYMYTSDSQMKYRKIA
jgi:Kelch motif